MQRLVLVVVVVEMDQRMQTEGEDQIRRREMDQPILVEGEVKGHHHGQMGKGHRQGQMDKGRDQGQIQKHLELEGEEKRQ